MLPKVINEIVIEKINVKNENTKIESYLLQSLLKYYIENKQILDEEIIQNNYDFLEPCILGKQFISKLKYTENIFYHFLEICSTFKLFEQYKLQNINTLHINTNPDTIKYIKNNRNNFNDKHIFLSELDINFIKNNDSSDKSFDESSDKSSDKSFDESDESFDFIFINVNLNNNENSNIEENININKYTINFIKSFLILQNQTNNGNAIFKISHLFYKPTIDILYLLSSVYDKVYIFKPKLSSKLIFENYIICQNFNASKFQNINFEILKLFIENENENISNISNISSILNYDIPYYFITKITDIMIIIGQQQLETINMLINTFKSKDKEEKIELIRKKNIQKSIEWCELYKVPCRIDKTNIFNLSCIENKL